MPGYLIANYKLSNPKGYEGYVTAPPSGQYEGRRTAAGLRSARNVQRLIGARVFANHQPPPSMLQALDAREAHHAQLSRRRTPGERRQSPSRALKRALRHKPSSRRRLGAAQQATSRCGRRDSSGEQIAH